jgi:hypothetical protein
MTWRVPSDEELEHLRSQVEAVRPDDGELDDERSEAWHRRVLLEYEWDSGRRIPGIGVSPDRDTPAPEAGLRGRGPRGHVRSDERILDDVCARLGAGYLDARDIEVGVAQGRVSLRGRVADRRARRLAEIHAEQAIGVVSVSNQLRVAGDDRRGG